MIAAMLMTALVVAATTGGPAEGPTGLGSVPAQGAATPGGTEGATRAPGDMRLIEGALDEAERAADAARDAVRQSQWAVARAHVDHLHGWLALATRLERPTGDAAVRWDFAAREARRLDAALMKRDATAARWADAALTLALADARASLTMAGGGGGRAEPAWDMEVVPDANDPRRVTDPAKKYENVPLERERPWSRGRQW